MQTLAMELPPNLTKPYLKLFCEALEFLNEPKGSFRKDIWDYLSKKYLNTVDYRDFLLGIRKFLADGKLEKDEEGRFLMPKAIVRDIMEKTPTPIISKKQYSSTHKLIGLFKEKDRRILVN